MFNLFRLCRQDEISFDIVAKNCNDVEATFDIVERIVQLVAFENVAWTLLLVYTGLNVVAEKKSLGVILDSRLSFDTHVAMVCIINMR